MHTNRVDASTVWVCQTRPPTPMELPPRLGVSERDAQWIRHAESDGLEALVVVLRPGKLEVIAAMRYDGPARALVDAMVTLFLGASLSLADDPDDTFGVMAVDPAKISALLTPHDQGDEDTTGTKSGTNQGQSGQAGLQ